ncbi:hypothetical protein [Hahella ganghwensis]|uniref:hypothetical protein n=1 Tax=Hahella ganghwensis TaxID=286420 RepID=UPI000379BDCF|nr:hypothetical protein [Hahella ganghwensis]
MIENRFFKESIPLLATYFSGKNVALRDMRISLYEGGESDFSVFENQLKARHYISIASLVLESIRDLQERHSTQTISSRTDSYGSIRGRLDTNRYVNQKFQRKKYPPSYPVIVSVQSASTPENMFAKALIDYTLKVLLSISIPTHSAEFERAKKQRRYLRDYLKMPPWSEITVNGKLSRLFFETKRRINRRQTSNERSYSKLLLAYENLTNSIDGASSIDSNPHLRDVFVTFPSDQSFLDRIFEVWCLKKIFDAIAGLGITCSQINSLEFRRTKPIFTFCYKSKLIEIWFQKQLPPSKSMWSYDTGGNLRGIPDITIICGDANLIVDAKNRVITTNTRSEETYKILGYLGRL